MAPPMNRIIEPIPIIIHPGFDILHFRGEAEGVGRDALADQRVAEGIVFPAAGGGALRAFGPGGDVAIAVIGSGFHHTGGDAGLHQQPADSARALQRIGKIEAPCENVQTGEQITRLAAGAEFRDDIPAIVKPAVIGLEGGACRRAALPNCQHPPAPLPIVSIPEPGERMSGSSGLSSGFHLDQAALGTPRVNPETVVCQVSIKVEDLVGCVMVEKSKAGK